MRFTATVVPVGLGAYSFDDGSKVPYVDFADPEGSGSDRATAGQGVDLDTLELFKPVALDFELYLGGREGKTRKLRTHGRAGVATVKAAA